MKREKRFILSIFWVVLGAVLIYLGFQGIVDSYWNGVGTGLFCIGLLQILRFYRFQKNEVYREQIEIAESDERNHFIRGKAWAWAGYLFILIAGVGAIVFKIAGQELLSLAASYAVCLIMILYWIAYMILKKKY